MVQYQFVQLDRRRIEARLVVEAPLSPAQKESLRVIVQDALGHPFEIGFRYLPDALPRNAGGKFEEFICRADPGSV